MSYNMKSENENILKGIGAAPGIGISKAFIYKKEKEEITKESITDIDEAIVSLDAALEKSKKELRKIFALAVDKLGEKRAAIFDAQIMILDDPILISTIKVVSKRNLIRNISLMMRSLSIPT